jgi:hypothetical protein
MTVIIILAALIALAWYLSKKLVAPKDSTFEFGLSEEDIINDMPSIETPKMAAKPKKAKDPLTKESKAKIIKHITETGEYVAPAKPKRKYNKKPKA